MHRQIEGFREWAWGMLIGAVGIFALCWLWGCATTDILTPQQRLDNPTFATLANAVHTVEVSNVALGGFLMVGQQVACGYLAPDVQLSNGLCARATAVLKIYTVQYAPKINAALGLAKKELALAASFPQATSLERLQTALTMLQEVFKAAAEWGMQYGWSG